MPQSPRILSGSKDGVDPELVRLRRGRGGRPVLTASVLVFALHLMVILRHDLRYGLATPTPRDLGAAAALAQPVQPLAVPDNALVALHGVPDHAAAARLRGTHTGHRLTPLQGTAGRVWIHEEGEAQNVKLVYDDAFVGRLRRLDDLAFGERLREHVATRPPQPRALLPEHLGAALPERDVAGDPLPVTPATRVTIDVRVPDAARIAFAATDQVRDPAAARAALSDAGISVGEPVQGGQDGWVFESRGVDAAGATERLRAARLFAAAAEPITVHHEGSVADLRLEPDRVVLGAATIPRTSIERFTLWLPTAVAPDALVLLHGERPGNLWYVKWLYLGLLVVIVTMGWALVRQVRELRRGRLRLA